MISFLAISYQRGLETADEAQRNGESAKPIAISHNPYFYLSKQNEA